MAVSAARVTPRPHLFPVRYQAGYKKKGVVFRNEKEEGDCQHKAKELSKSGGR